jgi:hypothetical protein
MSAAFTGLKSGYKERRGQLYVIGYAGSSRSAARRDWIKQVGRALRPGRQRRHAATAPRESSSRNAGQ